jgi:hypothetical protein
MARKQVLAPIQLETSKSLASTFILTPTEVSFQDNLAYEMVVTTSDSVGNFTLIGTLDSPDNLGSFALVNWVDLIACGSVSSANDVIGVDINQFPFKYISLRYTSVTPGTGTVAIKLMARTVGA